MRYFENPVPALPIKQQVPAEERQRPRCNPLRDPVVVIPFIRLELMRNAGFGQRCAKFPLLVDQLDGAPYMPAALNK